MPTLLASALAHRRPVANHPCDMAGRLQEMDELDLGSGNTRA